MKKICAWCNKDLGSVGDCNEDENTPITHGMCNDCVRENLSFKAISLKDFLNQFPDPVFLINYEGRVLTCNSSAYSLLQKNAEDVDGALGGNAFDCNYAELPGGCGNTLHCRTCTIRNTVIDTLESGRSNIKTPAYPDLHHITNESQVRFLITTEKVNETVLLRIDEVVEEPPPPSALPNENKSGE